MQGNDQEVDRDETDPYNEVIFGRRRPVSLVVDWTNKRSLEKVAGEAEGEDGSWKIKFIILVGGTSGSVSVQIFNDNLNELQVFVSKRSAIRKGLGYELLNAQDTLLCSCFAQRSGERSDCQNLGGTAAEVFQGLDNFE